MRKTTVTFRIDAAKKKALDELADGLDRDRSWILNEAVGSYLDLHQWQVEHIQKSIRDADAGNFASDAEVAAAFRRFYKRKSR